MSILKIEPDKTNPHTQEKFHSITTMLKIYRTAIELVKQFGLKLDPSELKDRKKIHGSQGDLNKLKETLFERNLPSGEIIEE